jgi:hypothetical protein
MNSSFNVMRWSCQTKINAFMESTLAAASVPQTKQGRHLNLRAHWLRDVQTLGDLVLAHLKGTLNDPTRLANIIS